MAKIYPTPPPAPAALAGELRRAGLSATPQRLAIYAALKAAMDHPNPEALHRRLKAALPSLSLATVYKTLHRLAAAGLAHEVSVAGENARRFDGNLGPHHHLVCERCHRVQDHCDEALDRVALPRRLKGFTPSSVVVHVLGLCSDCAAPPSHAAGARPARGARDPGR